MCRDPEASCHFFQITHKDYPNKPKKDALWEAIAKSVSDVTKESVSVDQCQKYWLALHEATRYVFPLFRIDVN